MKEAASSLLSYLSPCGGDTTAHEQGEQEVLIHSHTTDRQCSQDKRHCQDHIYRQLVSPDFCPKINIQEQQLASSTVDLRALRLQMESSLARLHDDFSVSLKLTNAPMLLGRKPQPLAKFFSPPHARHEEADDNPVHPTGNKGVWLKNVVKHCRWRQERGCERMLFLRWSEVTGREKTMRLAKIVSQLQQELDEVEMQLAESYDPARTQALDELSLRLIDKDMEIEREQEARETERAERERERVEWQKTREKEMVEVANALALVKDERLALQQQLDEEHEAQLMREVMREHEWEERIDCLRKEAMREVERLKERERERTDAQDRIGALEREKEAREKEIEALREHEHERDRVAEVRKQVENEKAMLNQEKEQIQTERRKVMVDREILENANRRLAEDIEGLAKERGKLSDERQKIAKSVTKVKEEEKEREKLLATDSRRCRRLVRLWAVAKSRLLDKLEQLRIWGLWVRFSLRSAKSRALSERFVAGNTARREHALLRSSLRTWIVFLGIANTLEKRRTSTDLIGGFEREVLSTAAGCSIDSDSDDLSPPRKKAACSSIAGGGGKFVSGKTNLQSRKGCRGWKHDSDSDASPPRQSKVDNTSTKKNGSGKSKGSSPTRSRRNNPDSDESVDSEKDEVPKWGINERTVSTSSSAIFGSHLRAGYIPGKEPADTKVKKKEIVDARFKKLHDLTSGRIAETLHRGKDGEKVEILIARKAADEPVGTYDHDRAIAPHHDVAFGACSTSCSKDILARGESGGDSEKVRVNESRTPLQHLGLALYNSTGERHVGNVAGRKVTGNLVDVDKENFEHDIGEVLQGPGLWTKRVGERHFHTSLLKNQTGARVYLKIRQVHEGHERKEEELQRCRRAEEENVGFGIWKYACEPERGIGKFACEKERIAQDLQQGLRAAEDNLLLLLEMRP